MKKFFAYIKHLWKDPVKSIAEIEERKKQIKPFLWGSIAAAVGTYFLNYVPVTAVATIGSLLSFIAIVVAVASGFLLWIMNKAKKKFELLTCDECKELIEYTIDNYQSYVSITGVTKDFKVDANVRDTNKGHVVEVKGEELTTAEVTVRCPKCNTAKHFNYTVRTFNTFASEIAHPLKINDVKQSLIDTTKNLYNTKMDEAHDTITQTGKISVPQKIDGIAIKYKRPIEDLIEGYFAKNELNGTLTKL